MPETTHDYSDRSEWLENTHPGEMLRLDWLEPLGITPYRLAKDLGLAESHVSELVRGKRNITALTAAMLGRYFGTSAEFWIGLQARHDLIEVRRCNGEKLERIVPHRQPELVAA